MRYSNAKEEGGLAVVTGGRQPDNADRDVFDVLGVAGRLYARVASVLESVGLTRHEYQALWRLFTYRGGVPVADLASAIRGPGADAEAVVGALADQGWAQILEDDAGVGSRVALTPLGEARALDGRTQIDIVLEEFAARFGARDRVQLRRLLDKVAV